MSVVQVACDRCGDQEVPIEGVTVRYYLNLPERSSVFIKCKLACGKEIIRNVNRETVEELADAGVRITICRIPQEAREPHFGPPISTDDWLDFSLELRRTIFVARELTP